MQNGQQRKNDPDVVEEIAVETPLGKLAAKGIRISDIGMIIGVGAIAYLIAISLAHKADAKESWNQVTAALAEHSMAIRAQTRAQHLQTCIMSLPMERRQREFVDPNSSCRRMVELP